MAATLKNPCVFLLSKPSINRVSLPSKLSFKQQTHRPLCLAITQSYRGEYPLTEADWCASNYRHWDAGALCIDFLDELPHFFERRGNNEETDLFVKIRESMKASPGIDSVSSALSLLKAKGQKLSKLVLSRLARLYMGHHSFEYALEVYEWMSKKGRRRYYEMTPNDNAKKLYLIALAHGTTEAQHYLEKLPDALQDKRLYTALLMSYVLNGKRIKAESLFDIMRKRGYAIDAASFNTMMVLYKEIGLYDKVQLMVSMMRQENALLDCRSYFIWMSCCQSQESLEQVFKKAQLDATLESAYVVVFSKMADMYNNLGELQRTRDCLKEIESRMTTKACEHLPPYWTLFDSYEQIGDITAIKRLWKYVEAAFPNMNYYERRSIISLLVRLGDAEGAEKILNEWNGEDKTFKANLLLNVCAEEGLSAKVEMLINQMNEFGIKPYFPTLLLLAQHYVRERRVFKAISCLQNAFLIICSDNNHMLSGWYPHLDIISSIIQICEEESDVAGYDALFDLLGEMGCDDSKSYMEAVYSFVKM